MSDTASVRLHAQGACANAVKDPPLPSRLLYPVETKNLRGLLDRDSVGWRRIHQCAVIITISGYCAPKADRSACHSSRHGRLQDPEEIQSSEWR